MVELASCAELLIKTVYLELSSYQYLLLLGAFSGRADVSQDMGNNDCFEIVYLTLICKALAEHVVH